MAFHQTSRHRQPRGRTAMSVVDKPASPLERVFAALTTLTMVLISAYLILA